MIILTDIEGTTSSISFVKEELFPYARSQMPAFLEAHSEEPAVHGYLNAIRAELPKEEAELDIENLAKTLQGWIDEDRKHPGLKGLQGLIWAEGYRSGHFHAHVYRDAYQYLYRWYTNRIPLWVYSSGSITAQKLFFGHSRFGDMSWFFRGYFDTTTGPKTDPASYRTIAERIAGSGHEILFLSDSGAELDAAAEAGLKTCQLVRIEDRTEPSGNHPQAADFSAVQQLL